MTPAFWISPDGYIVEVDINHINTVIKHPEKFGYTIRKIQSIYKRHRERMGTEGEARQQIILDLVKKGWIRLRRYSNRYWSITLGELNDTTKYILRQWSKLISGKGLRYYKEDDIKMPLKIYEIIPNRIIEEYDIEDCIKGKLKPSKSIKLKVKYLKSPEELP